MLEINLGQKNYEESTVINEPFKIIMPDGEEVVHNIILDAEGAKMLYAQLVSGGLNELESLEVAFNLLNFPEDIAVLFDYNAKFTTMVRLAEVVKDKTPSTPNRSTRRSTRNSIG